MDLQYRISENESQPPAEYYLFLDDVRMPTDVAKSTLPIKVLEIYRSDKWIIARDYFSFVNSITQKGFPACISFDHDLDGGRSRHLDIEETDGLNTTLNEKTGYDCAKWLINYVEEHQLTLPQIICHSMNSVGKQNIEALFSGYRRYLAIHKRIVK